VVKAMGHGREAAQKIHEYLMNLEAEHASLFERYYVKRSTDRYYQSVLAGGDKVMLPP
jgi:glutamate synthase (NADPH/NADH) small chain